MEKRKKSSVEILAWDWVNINKVAGNTEVRYQGQRYKRVPGNNRVVT